MWTKPTPLIKKGFGKKLDGSFAYGDAKACTDYKTGKTLYYTLSVGSKSWDFPTFESMLVFADLQDIKIDTWGWDTYGITRFYSLHDEIGVEKTFYDGSTAVLEGIEE